MATNDLVAAGKRTPASSEGGSLTNLEHCRKEAKALLRAFSREGDDAFVRARAVLGDRVLRRFALSDAQHVVAVERGYRSWPELRRAAERDARRESTVETDLRYRPDEPVLIRVVRRPGRVTVTDGGRALELAGIAVAGVAGAWRGVADRLERELDVNVARSGAVWLPVVRVGPPEAEVVERIGDASLAFYQDLLDLA
jgi:hypothetical protein